MGNLSKQERDKFYPLLVQRDGELCQYCRKTIDEVGLLVIHEVTYERPLKVHNMRLFCLSCNAKLRRATGEVQRDATPEYKKNLIKEPLFKKYVLEKIMENNFHYSYDDLIDGGAYHCDISIETAKRYLRKMMSPEAALTKPMASQNGELHCYMKGKEPYYD